MTLSTDETNVVLSTADGSLFVIWTALYAPAAEEHPDPQQALTNGSNLAGVATVSFAGPPAGAWTMGVTLLYAGDQGRASYFWHINAP